MRKPWIALFLAVALIACSRDGGQNLSAPEAAAPAATMAPTPPPMADGYAAGGGESDKAVDVVTEEAARDPSQALPGQPGAPAPVAYLAYAYALGLELPGGRLISVMESHVNACRTAGPRLCQLIGSTRDGDPDAYISGALSLRGEPAWLQRFMTSVAGDADEAGGRIKTQSTSTEDLTRAIIDTEATLRAKKALRDRLQRLLESRPGRLADLLEVERELARVQGEIDSTESNLAAMRTRVSMSALTISYESQNRPVASDTFEPLGEALANFLRYIVMGLSVIVTLIAVLIPWALLGALVVWLLLWLRKRRGGRLLPRKAPPAPEA